ncbi:MAG TPA: response regulator, partial [Candidatus Methylomirabilis sp.]|nr:response regulator [Candidatus Methylomirabilis sp.]
MHTIICSANPAIVSAVSHGLDHGEGRQTVCESGLEVLGLVGVLHSDLLVLDLETPGLGGLLLISAIRELAPELPILAVSTTPVADARALAQKGVPHAILGEGLGDGAPSLLAALASVPRRAGIGASPR